MLVNLKKYLFYGIKDEIYSFFAKAQKMGFIEFIGKKQAVKDFPYALKNLLSAIKLLKKQPVSFQKKDRPADEIAKKILELNQDIEKLRSMENELEKEVIKALPFGWFSIEDIDYIRKETNLVFQFFFIKSSDKIKQRVPAELIYVATEYDLDYYVSLSTECKNYPGFVEIKIARPASALKKHLDMTRESILLLERKMKHYASYLELLREAVFNYFNTHNLQVAKSETSYLLEDNLFTIEGWVPETKLDQLEKLLSNFLIHAERTKIEKNIRVPTYLENPPTAKVGEDLIKIYDIPSTDDKDPSLWVLIFFTLFFSIVVSDAGYGLVYLILAFIIKGLVKKPTPFMQRFIKLVFLLATGCTVWGVLTASFFGLNFAPDHPWQQISFVKILIEKKAQYHMSMQDEVYRQWSQKYPALKTAQDGHEFVLKALSDTGKYEIFDEFFRSVLLEISLLIGILHISLAYIINLRKNWAGVGWILFLIGGYLWAPLILKSTSLIYFTNLITKETAIRLGQYLLSISLPLVLVLALIQKKLLGLKEVAGIIGLFGDVLSYLRLYALALAGIVLSQTFNSFYTQFGLIIGIFLIIFGHLINISMSIMGGIIHGLRLNFLEWYNHCFEGGGKLFNPLRLFKK